MVENLFSMMVTPGPTKGSEEWIEHLHNNIHKTTVPDVTTHRVLLNAYVKHERHCNVISKKNLKSPLFPTGITPFLC